MGIYQKLRARLDQAGIRPSTRRGQNFLLDGNLLQHIASLGDLSPRDVVLEVGPGTGFLTRRLALSGALILAVELDRGLLPVAKEETEGLPNVFYLEGDILAGKNRLNPEAMRRLEELLEVRRDWLAGNGPGGVPGLKAVSNLPYSAGTPFVMNALASSMAWELGVFLMQLEVAERIVARPGSEHYGSLSIAAGLAATTVIDRVVGPKAFWPRPKVDSALIRMDFRPLAERAAVPWPEIRAVTNAVFGSRRKILKNALKGLFPNGEAGTVLAELGLDPEERGENLPPEEFLRLAHKVKAAGDGATF